MRVLKYYVKIKHYLRHENKVNEKWVQVSIKVLEGKIYVKHNQKQRDKEYLMSSRE